MLSASDPGIIAPTNAGPAAKDHDKNPFNSKFCKLAIRSELFSPSIIFSGIILIGLTPIWKARENAIHAKIALTVTQAKRMTNFWKSPAVIKLSFARKSSLVGSSPLRRTNHPKGIQFAVRSVPLASVKRVLSFGGIPIPNSRTFTFAHFAAK